MGCNVQFRNPYSGYKDSKGNFRDIRCLRSAQGNQRKTQSTDQRYLPDPDKGLVGGGIDKI